MNAPKPRMRLSNKTDPDDRPYLSMSWGRPITGGPSRQEQLRIMEKSRDPEGLTSNIVHFHKHPDGRYSHHTVEKKPCTDEQRQMALLDPVICTGLVWQAMAMAGRVEIAVAAMLPTGIVTSADMLRVLPGSTQAYLAFWQRQVNTGECWFSPWRIGEIATGLLDDGYVLLARKRMHNFYGKALQSRYTQKEGRPGTDAFVSSVMGPEYHRWIREIQ